MLSVVILPKVLREKSPQRLLEFESVYEKIGMPALLIQVASGLYLAYRLLPDLSLWFNFVNPISQAVALKLTLLGLTVAFAIDARFRVIPKLSEKNLVDMAIHIVAVTLFSILFVGVGVSFRVGGIG